MSKTLQPARLLNAPEGLQPSIRRFLKDHPDPSKTAFIMMRFGTGAAQTSIADAIKETCHRHGITALRADDLRYAQELWPNVCTYMHGCCFGIAVFERVGNRTFNANVSLEVGFMLALGKSVCLLKDKSLKGLQSDISGFIYEAIDTQSPENSVRRVLGRWLWEMGYAPTSRRTAAGFAFGAEVDWRTDALAVLTVYGDVDVYTAPMLQKQAWRLVEDGCRYLVIQAAHMGTMDSCGLGVLVGLVRRLKESRGELLVAAPSVTLRKVLEITRLTEVISVCDSVPAAIATLEPGASPW